ncbi:GNAT family N-acetyltransferase [Sulfitobacter donghicola]|uniref:GNAT family acetyltransferase n=1 Tax=Sulfitobacter donghicola DSW-25 = KCTC 12864 = JCM 14565 TaxID=1300350 RepID=A0A073IHV5_9RHOB|nr:GNAT family N-acetyltransferase [Sulfitobacter donghicola]KEJ89923.1 GNAT family acetyltransferase [Sulfitobacter donghicola DSW-25 = KCTC 12864 = JCM 14565]KIN66952.1 Phosphinothricin N-acetyltransferase [Sulfitobacter donghicola DSW-25 = KCTC 12864 = JCM 14565]
MLIRPATRTDLPTVKMLWNRMIRDTTSTFTSIEKTDEALEQLLLERADRFLVAEENGKCSGFVTWGSFRAGDGYVRTAEHSIITEKAGQGTGRALMESALRVAHQQGIHVMVAGIGHENPPAVAFHQKLGFAKVGRLPQVGYKNGRWHDLILMSRITQTP